MTNLEKLAKECMKHVKCDTARISKPCDKMYLIIGYNYNTKDDEGVWVNQDNQRIDFDYVKEFVVASGHTKKELIESTKEYQRLCGITWEQYFQELAQKNCRAVGNNEQTKEVCDFCSNPVTNYKTNTCDKCSVLRRL